MTLTDMAATWQTKVLIYDTTTWVTPLSDNKCFQLKVKIKNEKTKQNNTALWDEICKLVISKH